MIVSRSKLRIDPYLFNVEKLITQFKTTAKNDESPYSFREINDLPLWRVPAVKEKSPFFNRPALITREIMHSRDAQRNTGE